MILKKESIFEISEITGYTMSNIMNLLKHKRFVWRNVNERNNLQADNRIFFRAEKER